MLESILRNRSEIEAFLHSQDDEEHVALLEQLSQGVTRGTSWDYLLAQVSIMGVFKRAIDLLRSRDRPTLHLVSYLKPQPPQMLDDIKFARAAMKHNMRAVIAELKAYISNNRPGWRTSSDTGAYGNLAAAFPNLLHQETETGLDEAVMEGVRLPSFITFAPPTSTGDGEGAVYRPAAESTQDMLKKELQCYLGEKLSTKEILESCQFLNNENKDAYVYFDILGYWKQVPTARKACLVCSGYLGKQRRMRAQLQHHALHQVRAALRAFQ
ncbi:uncharacterized protein PHALS_13749 [Plasmopara halstedii]|uniref:Uncharacterized protein n=1 Tax=Plasmopara halstedii TaxID=4781 RepID=A0A0P1AQG2_PLAHL|nr:uncharacterized protein PHALS_13749 [Plasmopara halstedii]CEG43557.1 hypothetical protein PHALS_13749 [Plasmopara halstedii]|eukprot:XP_024579926.1 hypothetical protein PHALS_13749 [Plasmopara halstedii]